MVKKGLSANAGVSLAGPATGNCTLDRNLFPSLSGAFGMTEDTPDETPGVSLPIRF